MIRLIFISFIFFTPLIVGAVGATTEVENSAHRTLCAKSLADIFSEDFGMFTRVDGLGEGESVAIINKKDVLTPAQREQLNTHRQQQSVRNDGVRSDIKVSFEGFIAPFRFKNLSDPSAIDFNWAQRGPDAHGFVQNGRISVTAFLDRIIVLDTATGKRLNEIRNPLFSGLHTVAFFPHSNRRILVTNAGFGNLIEVDIWTGETKEIWHPWRNGYSEFHPRLHAVEKGDNLDRFQRVFTLKEAQAIFEGKAVAQDFVPADQVWAVEVDRNQVDSVIGLPRWMRTSFPNWADFYGDENNVLATFYASNEAVRIDLRSGKVSRILGGLGRPHGVIPYNGGFIVSDTFYGRVLFLDANLSPTRIVNFSNMPATTNSSPNEWLQNTYPIGKDGLLASVDSRRGKIYFWNPEKKVFSEYNIPGWEVQAIVPFEDIKPNYFGADQVRSFIDNIVANNRGYSSEKFSERVVSENITAWQTHIAELRDASLKTDLISLGIDPSEAGGGYKILTRLSKSNLDRLRNIFTFTPAPNFADQLVTIDEAVRAAAFIPTHFSNVGHENNELPVLSTDLLQKLGLDPGQHSRSNYNLDFLASHRNVFHFPAVPNLADATRYGSGRYTLDLEFARRWAWVNPGMMDPNHLRDWAIHHGYANEGAADRFDDLVYARSQMHNFVLNYSDFETLSRVALRHYLYQLLQKDKNRFDIELQNLHNGRNIAEMLFAAYAPLGVTMSSGMELKVPLMIERQFIHVP